MFQIVEFQSEGATLRGRLYSHADPDNPSPIVVMAHGFAATIDEMVADRYAEHFYGLGFSVLLYDHYSLGISDGEPRAQMNKFVQCRGYMDAVSYVSTLPGIAPERIALWGDSMSAGEVIVVAAIDPRVKAIVAQVPACGRTDAPPDPDGRLFASLRNDLLNADLNSLPQNVVGPMPVVSFDQNTIPSLLIPLTAYRWFIEYGCRYGSNWENYGTRNTPLTEVAYHPGLCAPYVQAAAFLLIADNDEMPGAETEVAHKVFDMIPEPKEVLRVDGGHFGLVFYPSAHFDQSSKAQGEFLLAHL